MHTASFGRVNRYVVINLYFIKKDQVLLRNLPAHTCSLYIRADMNIPTVGRLAKLCVGLNNWR